MKEFFFHSTGYLRNPFKICVSEICVKRFRVNQGVGVCIGNYHFLTTSYYCQTYKNYQQSQQKMSTFLENKVFKVFKKWLKIQDFVFIDEVVNNFGRCDHGLYIDTGKWNDDDFH